MFHVPERWRVQLEGRPTNRGDPFGWFVIPPNPAKRFQFALRCLASDGADWKEMEREGLFPVDSGPWEHVSVSIGGMLRCPRWEEMCYVKDIFWDPEDVVMQLHPRASEYVNMHPFCLHLWRPRHREIPTPPPQSVGVNVIG